MKGTVLSCGSFVTPDVPLLHWLLAVRTFRKYTPVDMCLFCHITATATATAITTATAVPLRPFLLSPIFLLSHSIPH
jgi:hypothetical protein